MAVDLSDEAVMRVVEAALAATPDLKADNIMLVGALCRNALHRRLGHSFPMTSTYDLDLALALSSWDAYRAVANAFPSIGDSGIRFRIAGIHVDLLPFGDVEDPPGLAEPPTRQEKMGVWAFKEIFAAADQMVLTPNVTIKIPTVPGYAVTKIGAWLDRSAYGQPKDAPDIALVLFWYAHSSEVADRLYDTNAGREILLDSELNVTMASARLLGSDISAAVGPERRAELLQRWPGNLELLTREMSVRTAGATHSRRDRQQQIVALTKGLTG